MNSSPAQAQNALCSQALAAERGGALERAAELYRQAIDCLPANPTPYLFLGAVLQQLDGDENDAAVQVWSLAADIDPRLVNAWRNPQVADNLRRLSKQADEAMRQHYDLLHRASMTRYRQRHPGADIARIEAAIWCQTHPVSFRYPNALQRPHVFLVPGLAPVPVFAREDLPWSEALEAATAQIREEFLAVQESIADAARPYLEPGAAAMGDDWQPLADSLNWSAFHLYKQAVPNEDLLALFPRTLAALREVPLLDRRDAPQEVLFSVLRGGQHIPPHYGLANTDVTVHLPLVTSSAAGIRVCERDYGWREGKVFAFDDAFYHESWNRASALRVNLLFEAWHPDLGTDERGAIRATFDDRERWNLARSY
jgi:hypothetical protein